MTMTKAIPVKAICIKTGAVSHFRSVTEAADVGGFSQACITKVLNGAQKHHAGHTFESEGGKRGTPRSRARTLQIKALREQGRTLEDIAAIVGCALATVHYHVKIKL